MTRPAESGEAEGRWLLLIHQLPAKPAYLRVKVWRRLQALGAVAVKNTVYALPASDERQEDLEWVLREITEGGGEGLICEARLIDGLTDQEVRALFDRVRDEDYAELAEQARALAADLQGNGETRTEAAQQLRRLRSRLTQVVEIDFFGANGREAVEGLLDGMESQLAGSEDVKGPSGAEASFAELTNRVWVTREGVHVDRIASAWLVRRFIDPNARFKFVRGKGYVPREGELRFDMFEAEFTHEGDRCTFEVLLGRMGVSDPALQAVAEIVHDIDLKDAKFGRAEAEGIKTLIAGICMATRKDDERLSRGSAVFEDLYSYFQKRRRG